MIKSRLAVCAETIIRDTQSNNVSVINILEEVSVAEFPSAFTKLSALFMLERDNTDPEQVDAAILITLDDEELGRATMNGDFEGKLRTRLIVVAKGFPIPRPGLLTVTAIINEHALSSWSIPISQADKHQEDES